MKRAWQVVEMGFFGLLLLLGALAFLVLWHITARQTNSQKDFWDIVSALGTAAAAIIALGIALSQGRTRRKEDLLRAEMLAARLLPRLIVAEAECKSLGERLFFYRAKERNDIETLDPILASVRKIDLKLSTADLATLAPLPEQCAAQLAYAVGHMDALQAAILAAGAAEILRPFDVEESERWCAWAASARIGFQAAMRQCVLVVEGLQWGDFGHLLEQMAKDVDF